ncbi:MAG: hypothetical protein ABFD79_14680 [Phycisphaerales bacterium]
MPCNKCGKFCGGYVPLCDDCHEDEKASNMPNEIYIEKQRAHGSRMLIVVPKNRGDAKYIRTDIAEARIAKLEEALAVKNEVVNAWNDYQDDMRPEKRNKFLRIFADCMVIVNGKERC